MALPKDNTPWPLPEWSPLHDMVASAAVWWEGDTAGLESHYAGQGSGRTFRPSQFDGGVVGAASRMFWGKPRTSGQPRKKLHLPLAADVAGMSANLLFETPAQAHLAQSGKVGGEPVRAGNDAAAERLDALFNTDAMASSLLVAAESCAALGGVYGRVMWDQTLQPDPWIDWVDADSAIPEWRYGRLSAVTFVEELPRIDKKTVHRLLSRHTPGRIEYTLMAGRDNNLGDTEPLEEHPSTVGLAAVVDADGGVATGITRIAAVYIPNVQPIPAFRRSGQLRNMGRPDLPSDTYGLLDMLDEVWTDLKRELRTAKARVIVPEMMLNFKGAGNGMEFDPEREIYSAVADTPASIENGSPMVVQPQIRVEQYLRACDALVREVLRRASYSPGTFGLNDTTSGAVTAREIEANSRATLQTFKAKARHWKAGLAHLAAAMVELDAILNRTGAVLEDLPEIDIAPPVQETLLDKAQTLQALESARAISTDEKVRAIHPDWDEQRIDREVATIHQEQGVMVGDPWQVDEDTPPNIPDTDLGGANDPDQVKKRADAMGTMIRAGVDAQSAAEIAGVHGARFTGGKPITLKYDTEE